MLHGLTRKDGDNSRRLTDGTYRIGMSGAPFRSRGPTRQQTRCILGCQPEVVGHGGVMGTQQRLAMFFVAMSVAASSVAVTQPATAANGPILVFATWNV
jgi:hypothetical protein